MIRKINIFKSIDWLTILLYLALVVFGWLNIYAAVYSDEHQGYFDIAQRHGRQLVWIIFSFVVCVVILIIESRFYSIFAYPIYIFNIAFLLFVLFFGKEVNASRSWIGIGEYLLQPAEFGKVATSIGLARFLSPHDSVRPIMDIKNIAYIALIIFLPAGIIILQNDTGSALVYFALILALYREGLPGSVLVAGTVIIILFFAVLLVEMYAIVIAVTALAFFVFGLLDRKYKDLTIIVSVYTGLAVSLWLLDESLGLKTNLLYLLLIAAGLTLIPTLIYAFRYKLQQVLIIAVVYVSCLLFAISVGYIFDNVLGEHQRNRINVLLGITQDIHGVGYNVYQSKVAIGSGGLNGKGFLQGTQTKYNFVPAQTTDFIFCTVGEEWGFIGTFSVIIVFVILLLRLVYLAERQRSTFSRIFGYCVVSILFFHIAVNIGMTIGLTPVIGIPLPFFSYGGSSFLAFSMLLFIFIRLDSSRLQLL